MKSSILNEISLLLLIGLAHMIAAVPTVDTVDTVDSPDTADVWWKLVCSRGHLTATWCYRSYGTSCSVQGFMINSAPFMQYDGECTPRYCQCERVIVPPIIGPPVCHGCYEAEGVKLAADDAAQHLSLSGLAPDFNNVMITTTLIEVYSGSGTTFFSTITTTVQAPDVAEPTLTFKSTSNNTAAPSLPFTSSIGPSAGLVVASSTTYLTSLSSPASSNTLTPTTNVTASSTTSYTGGASNVTSVVASTTTTDLTSVTSTARVTSTTVKAAAASKGVRLGGLAGIAAGLVFAL